MELLNSVTRMKLEELKRETGYNIVQQNGQRRFGPPANWEGPPPPRGTEVFIGNLPRDVFEYDLVPVLSSVGRIYEFRLMMDFSGSNRGFAFAVYSTINEAKRAIKELNGYQIRPGRHIGVVKSVDNCRLYVGGIPKRKSKEEIFTELNKLVSGIVDLQLYQNCYKKNLNRGFVFVEFASHRAAAMARRSLVPGVSRLFDREIIVDWAEPEPDIDDELMEQENPCDQRAQTEGTNACGVDNSYNSHIETKLSTQHKPSELLKVTTAVYELYEMCKNYGWGQPEYLCKKHDCWNGYQGYITHLDVPLVKLPLMHTPICFNFTSKLCNTIAQAKEHAAQQAVQCLKEGKHNGLVYFTSAPLQPFYRSPITNVYNTRGYNYINSQIYQSAPLALPAPNWQ